MSTAEPGRPYNLAQWLVGLLNGDIGDRPKHRAYGYLNRVQSSRRLKREARRSPPTALGSVMAA